jgi:GTP-binding protein
MDVLFLKSAFKESHYPSSDKPEVAFAGKSNVGKSSLLNVLVNRKKLARTSSTPGRTQSLNFFEIKNKNLYMVDLPGYGFASVPLEIKKSWGSMVETYLSTRANLKAVVVIIDIRREPGEGDLNLLDWLNQYGVKSIIVLTKADKLSRTQAAERARLIGNAIANTTDVKPIIFSAKTREGMREIWEEIDKACGT